MNVRLQSQFELLASYYWNGQYSVNRYNIILDMITVTYDADDQNIAFDRMKYMLYSVFSDSVFVHQDDSEAIKHFEDLEINVIKLPDVPVDQIVGMMLFYKLNAVCEEKLFITQVGISSSRGQNLVYLHDEEEDSGPFESVGWWHSSEPNCMTNVKNNNKIVSLGHKESWGD